jgi:hypothetical protein
MLVVWSCTAPSLRDHISKPTFENWPTDRKRSNAIQAGVHFIDVAAPHGNNLVQCSRDRSRHMKAIGFKPACIAALHDKLFCKVFK